jgi:hypothetical protein
MLWKTTNRPTNTDMVTTIKIGLFIAIYSASILRRRKMAKPTVLIKKYKRMHKTTGANSARFSGAPARCNASYVKPHGKMAKIMLSILYPFAVIGFFMSKATIHGITPCQHIEIISLKYATKTTPRQHYTNCMGSKQVKKMNLDI